MIDKGAQEKPSRAKLILAFAAVYIIWGSTYLAIRYAIETLPAFLFAGSRFLIAGAVLYGWARLRGATVEGWANWRTALIVGGLLLLGGNGAVVLAEKSVPSGLAALLIATEPLMIVLLEWAGPGGRRPEGRVALGLAVGLIGMFLLVGPSSFMGQSHVDLAGAGLLAVGSLSWAAGSLYAAKTPVAKSPLLAAGMQMLAGGALLFLTGLAKGEASQFALSNVSLRSGAAFFYLVIFGSIVGFTSYSWLLRVTPPSLASTYAYVNPVVAVLLGWALAGEPLTARTGLAAAVIVSAVVMITSYKPKSAGSARKRIADKKADRFIKPIGKHECVEVGD